MRLGSGRKKLQRWRRPKGIHNKMRERRKGYPSRPELGMKGKVKQIPRINNLSGLAKLPDKSEIILAHIGKRNKTRIIEEANKKNIKILNMRNEK